SIRRNRHWAGIALVSISGEIDLHQRRSTHDDVRDSDALAGVEPRAKVGMHRHIRSDEIDVVVGVRVDRSAGNVLVPEIVSRKRKETIEARTDAEGHAAATILRGQSRVK